MLRKDKLPSFLETVRTIIRLTSNDDLSQFLKWKNYPEEYKCFNMVDGQERLPDGRFWWERIEKEDRIFYSVLLKDSNEIIGIYAFTRINWNEGTVDNMVMRLRPDYCDKGYGNEVLSTLLKNMLANGFKKIRLDVVATNLRAIRSYEKSGMYIESEFWQPHGGEPIDFNHPYWQSLKSHFKETEQGLMVRFYYMEITQ